MNNTNQIKTHFDRKIITFFVILFTLSCALLAFKKNIQSNCDVSVFKIEPSPMKAGNLITFSDTTKNSFDWKWNFGDGSKTAYLSKVSHSFDKEGTYNVKVLINNNCTVEKSITILPSKVEVDESLFPKFSAPQNAVEGQAVSFKDLSINAKSWEWRFGDSGNYAVDNTDKNPTYTYKTFGKKTVTLVINGDYKHVKKIDIFVSKAKTAKVKTDAPIVTYKKRGPKEIIVNEEYFKGMLVGVSTNVLSYTNFTHFFCKDALPDVHLRDGTTVTLKELDEKIRGKKIKIKSLSYQKDKDECVTFIVVDFR